jgi:hypothetical protein
MLFDFLKGGAVTRLSRRVCSVNDSIAQDRDRLNVAAIVSSPAMEYEG